LVLESCFAVEALESRRTILVDDEEGMITEPDIPGSRGETALGVVALVDWSSDSKPASRGVIGLCMPGMYPGSLGVGEVFLESEYIPGAGEVAESR